jgi:hypothetical protein
MLLSKTRSLLRSFSFPTWSVPFALLILTFLSYGLRISSLGFYWDDWPYLWFFDRLGPDGIVQAFAGDRPFLSFIYIICLSIFGHSILGWQAFALLARWLCSLGLWWALTLAWPTQKHKATWAIFLFTIYPGFTQQWISVIYGQAFFLWAASFFSIGVTLWLARHKSSSIQLVIGTALGLALSAFTMFSTEYFFGLELLRPALLWLVIPGAAATAGAVPASERWKNMRRRILKVAAWWAPYLILMLVFVYWRSFIHVFAGYQMTALQGLEQSPLSALRSLVLNILKDLIVSTLVAWGQPLQLSSLFETSAANWLRVLAVIFITGVLTALYFDRLRPQSGDIDLAPEQNLSPIQNCWAVEAILVGVFAMLVAGWPFWITQLPLRMGFPQDRFSLPLSVGACLLFAGLVDLAGKNLLRKAIILGMAVALATGFHFNTAAAYHDDWVTARDFFWQLAWRAPSIQPRTLFLSTNLPFKYFEDDSLTAPLNWTFDPDGTSTQMKYILYDLFVRYHNLPPLNPRNPVEKDFRGMQFNGTTARTLIFYYAPPGCVRILDPIYDADLYQLPKPLLAKINLSNPSFLIQEQNTQAAPPVDIFGSEPKHRWCYFFEKADLARQNGDWKAIIELSKKSIRSGFRPEDPAEYLPFIEAYLRIGHLADGLELTQSTYHDNPALRPALCAAWRRSTSDIVKNGVDISGGLYQQAITSLQCPTP